MRANIHAFIFLMGHLCASTFLCSSTSFAHENIFANATLLVTNTNNSGAGSLRDKVAMAASGDTICFDAAINGLPIRIITQITINKNLWIIGNNQNNTIIDGLNTTRIFEISAGDTVKIEKMRIREGRTPTRGAGVLNNGTVFFTDVILSGNDSDFIGGGLHNDNGTVTFINTTISGNTAMSTGGGVYNASGIVHYINSTVTGNTTFDFFGGGMHNASGTVTFFNSTLSNNNAPNDVGGGLYNASGTVTFDSSTVSGNHAIDGGGLYVSGTSAQLFFNNSVISGNTASADGWNGGDGGGTYNFKGDLHFVNSRLSGNSASKGGALYNSGSSGTARFVNSVISGNTALASGGGVKITDWSDEVTFINTTLAGNSADKGGGVNNAGNQTTFINAIVAKNIDGGAGPDIYNSADTILSNGHNLIGKNKSVETIFPSDGILIGTSASPVDPLFVTNVNTGTLPNSTGNLRLMDLSPAIDAGDPDTTGLNLPLTDLGGDNRVNGFIDLGAYENQVCPDILVIDNTFAPYNGYYKASISIHIEDGVTIPLNSFLTLNAPMVTVDPNVIVDPGGGLTVFEIGCVP